MGGWLIWKEEGRGKERVGFFSCLIGHTAFGWVIGMVFFSLSFSHLFFLFNLAFISFSLLSSLCWLVLWFGFPSLFPVFALALDISCCLSFIIILLAHSLHCTVLWVLLLAL